MGTSDAEQATITESELTPHNPSRPPPICYPLRVRQVVTIALASLTLGLAAQTAVDISKLGPQVGVRVTDFSLADQRGTTQSLRAAAGPKGTMLVFFRVGRLVTLLPHAAGRAATQPPAH